MNKKYRRLTLTILLMAGLIVLQPFLWGFVSGQALVVQQQRSQGQQIANMKERNAEVLHRLEIASEFLSQVDAVSPPITAKTQVVERIEQLADQLGLAIDIALIQEVALDSATPSNDQVAPVSVSVTATGTIQQLLNFLDRVEHTQELSIVPHWGLAPAPGSPSAGSSPLPADATPYTLTMEVYFFLRRGGYGQ